MGQTLSVRTERWPIAGRFVIARGAKTQARVVVAEISDGRHRGRGECVPYARFGETGGEVAATIRRLAPEIAGGAGRRELQLLLPAGAARNALDCAFWDLEAKRSGRRAWQLAGLAAPLPCPTAYTISLGTPDEMAAAAARASDRPLLKIKLGGGGDEARIAAVRRTAPRARLIADANESWREEEVERLLSACREAGIELVEQPLPADRDAALARIVRRVPVYADESVRERSDLARLAGRYDGINIKLDKAGGLTEALALADAARAAGLRIMVGCMVATSLAMAPATLLAPHAQVIDLDGPLLLARDRAPGLVYADGLVHPPDAELWG